MYCIFLLDNVQYIEYTMIKVTTDCNIRQKGANDNENHSQRKQQRKTESHIGRKTGRRRTGSSGNKKDVPKIETSS